MKFKFQFVALWSPVDCEVEAATLEEAKEMVDADGIYNFVAEEQSEGAFDPPDTSDPVWEGETPAPIENVVASSDGDEILNTLVGSLCKGCFEIYRKECEDTQKEN